MLSKGESKRAEDHAHPGSPTVRGRPCAGPNYLMKASQGFWTVKRWELKEFTQSHIAGIGEQDLNANLLGCKAPACFTALSLGSGVHAVQQWEGVQTASLSRLMEQQSHFLSSFLSSSISSLLYCKSLIPPVPVPPCLDGYSSSSSLHHSLFLQACILLPHSGTCWRPGSRSLFLTFLCCSPHTPTVFWTINV